MPETKDQVFNNSQRIIQDQMLKSRLAVVEQRLIDMGDRIKFLEDTIKQQSKKRGAEV